jgi:subfamily B ATP-binding cassette protein MsbA
MMVFATLLETAIPEITGQIVDTLFSNNRSSNKAFYYSVILFSVIALSSLFALTSISASSWISKSIIDLRVDMFSKLIKLPKTILIKIQLVKLFQNLPLMLNKFLQLHQPFGLNLLKSSFTVIILTGYLFYKNFLLSLILLILLPLVYLQLNFN